MSMEFTQHVFITGKTNTGKTTFGSEYFKDNDGLNIFFNIQEEYCVEEKADIIITSVGELESAIAEKNTHICFNPELAGEDINIAQIGVTIRMLMAMGAIAKREAKGRPEVWATVYIDEIQEFGEKTGHPIIHRLWKRGLGYGIQAVGLSQRPADVSHTVLTQSQDHVIFYVGGYDHPYFKKYQIPIEDHMNHLEQTVMIDGKEVQANFVVWEKQDEIVEYNKLSI